MPSLRISRSSVKATARPPSKPQNVAKPPVKAKKPARKAPAAPVLSKEEQAERRRLARERIAAVQGSAQAIASAELVVQQWLRGNGIEAYKARLDQILEADSRLKFDTYWRGLVIQMEALKRGADLVKSTRGMLGSHKREIDERLEALQICTEEHLPQLANRARMLGLRVVE